MEHEEDRKGRQPFYENTDAPERAVLVGIDTGDYDAESSMLELEALSETAGAQVVAKVMQKRDKPDTATYIGSGRLEEIKAFCEENEIDLLIFDGELSPVQQRNIEDATQVRVIDRTTLILDIFAAHARSGEGKLQVEIAQLKYMLPRLTGMGQKLSRLGGGIGTRGPGETKLESDRRHIRRRINSLEQDLATLRKHREMTRARRKKDGIETVAIVGYTNAGKSTLMNALTQAGVVAQDQLFVTLDPTARALILPDGRRVMLVDTVGLIQRLPHHLVEAFRSTLEEAAQADLILNVCDASNEECAAHLRVTAELLDALGCMSTPIISVLNKCDKAFGIYDLPMVGRNVRISALTGEGLDELLETISRELPPTRRTVELLIPYQAGGAAAQVRKEGALLAEEYRADGLYLKCVLDVRLIERMQDYLIE